MRWWSRFNPASQRPDSIAAPSARFAPVRRRGLSLIEVVASLALLASVGVALLSARASHTKQWNRANRRIEAISATDALLAAWSLQSEGMPESGSGELMNSNGASMGMIWRVTTIADETAQWLDAHILRLEVFDDQVAAQSSNTPSVGRSLMPDEPLLTIELLQHLPSRQARDIEPLQATDSR